ncbi:MAG: iron-containing alcohol dehydrogenase [Oscillospiraceae bacterium]
MMRPIKLGGDQMIFGEGCLEYLKTLKGKKACIVSAGKSMQASGALDKVIDYLKEAGIESKVIFGIEPDPKFSTVYKGAKIMLDFEPDLIVALGGGSAMDAAKAMWIYYEAPQLTTLQDIIPPNKIPKLRNKARLVCIPSTAGTASEVSRSIVITDDDTHIKYGIGDMEMMPDIAICDPWVTASMPTKVTADTGMDALTHSLEALASQRANFLSDILAKEAIKDIIKYLPLACKEGSELEYREKMLNASTISGMAFTNVSLGIVHSMAHTLGSIFSLPHGLSNAILLPYVMKFNMQSDKAKEAYALMAKEIGADCLLDAVKELQKEVGIPSKLSEVISNKDEFMSKLDQMAEMALNDGCTKTNPIIPTIKQLKELYVEAF